MGCPRDPPTQMAGDYMATKREMTKEQMIKKEERRLRKNYRDLPKETLGSVDGLIREAAYMRVQLELYRRDLDQQGYTEMFRQSEKVEPYERERPVARLYNTMNKNYQTIIKQLSDMLPKPKPGKQGEVDDGFDDFVQGA